MTHSIEQKKAYDKARYEADPDYFIRKSRAYRAKRPRYNAYLDQRQAAKRRNIEFNFTFIVWPRALCSS